MTNHAAQSMLLISPECPIAERWFPGEQLCLVDDERHVEVYASSGKRRYLLLGDKGQAVAGALMDLTRMAVVSESYPDGQPGQQCRKTIEHCIRRDFPKATWEVTQPATPHIERRADRHASPVVSTRGAQP